MNNIEEAGITLLTAEQASGENALDCIKKYGSIVGITDLAILQGSTPASACDKSGRSKIHLAGIAYTSSRIVHETEKNIPAYVLCNGEVNFGDEVSERRTQNKEIEIYSVAHLPDGTELERELINTFFSNEIVCYHVKVRQPFPIPTTSKFIPMGIRPVLLPQITKDLTPQNVQTLTDGSVVGEYGEYPNYVNNLEYPHARIPSDNRSMKKTGKFYTFNETFPEVVRKEKTKPYQIYCLNKYPEYRNGNKKYVCIYGNPSYDTLNCHHIHLAEERIALYGQPYFLEVQPIKWLIDEKTGIWVAKDCILSGIPLYSNFCESEGPFEQTVLYKYLNTNFRYEMLPTNEYLKVIKKQKNPYFADYPLMTYPACTGLKGPLEEFEDIRKQLLSIINEDYGDVETFMQTLPVNVRQQKMPVVSKHNDVNEAVNQAKQQQR